MSFFFNSCLYTRITQLIILTAPHVYFRLHRFLIFLNCGSHIEENVIRHRIFTAKCSQCVCESEIFFYYVRTLFNFRDR